MMACNSVQLRRSGAGFSIVEVLVALVVLSVGMLGIASLYVVTLRSSGSAISRMQAVNLASDLADRIRANRNGREAYAEAAADEGCVGATASCNPEEMAAHDLYLWDQQLEATLGPSATGTVVVEGAGTLRTYTITVSWREPTEPDALSYVMRMQI